MTCYDIPTWAYNHSKNPVSGVFQMNTYLRFFPVKFESPVSNFFPEEPRFFSQILVLLQLAINKWIDIFLSQKTAILNINWKKFAEYEQTRSPLWLLVYILGKNKLGIIIWSAWLHPYTSIKMLITQYQLSLDHVN